MMLLRKNRVEFRNENMVISSSVKVIFRLQKGYEYRKKTCVVHKAVYIICH